MRSPPPGISFISPTPRLNNLRLCRPSPFITLPFHVRPRSRPVETKYSFSNLQQYNLHTLAEFTVQTRGAINYRNPRIYLISRSPMGPHEPLVFIIPRDTRAPSTPNVLLNTYSDILSFVTVNCISLLARTDTPSPKPHDNITIFVIVRYC